MTLFLPRNLPSVTELRDRGLDVIEVDDAADAPAEALHIGILNLMPDKVATELQLIRMLAHPRHDVVITLFATTAYMQRARQDGYSSANTPIDHLRAFYRSFDEVRETAFDGLIITGAPVEQVPFDDVPYWHEMLQILDWSRARSLGVFNICWAAQAALKHFHGVPKHVLNAKRFGVFSHDVLQEGSVLPGVTTPFDVPVSRHSETRRADLPADSGLQVLADSDETGICLLEDPARGHVYMLNHFEYDADTLKREYDRDKASGAPIALPVNYYPGDDDTAQPIAKWSENARTFYGNWLDTVARRRGGD
ncbi:MAG: homoserine O-succinyltransferase [Minwuia sp.]|nr:homoserine O-succinyltransferase [Minwuia sp.]